MVVTFDHDDLSTEKTNSLPLLVAWHKTAHILSRRVMTKGQPGTYGTVSCLSIGGMCQSVSRSQNLGLYPTCLCFTCSILRKTGPIRAHRPYKIWKACFIDNNIGRVNLDFERATRIGWPAGQEAILDRDYLAISKENPHIIKPQIKLPGMGILQRQPSLCAKVRLPVRVDDTVFTSLESYRRHNELP